ncbi:MAG: hypothetical protein HGGPFJEG_00766 [Ignavibacteria bacterium]|nr:hypothetical protein [Ignavibacteria bacterium]
MSKKSTVEYLQKIIERFNKGGKEEKKIIFDEFYTDCSNYRNYEIKLLNKSPLQEL